VWEGRFGSILIEVIGDEIFVNGKRVEQHTGWSTPRGPSSRPVNRRPSAGAVGFADMGNESG